MAASNSDITFTHSTQSTWKSALSDLQDLRHRDRPLIVNPHFEPSADTQSSGVVIIYEAWWIPAESDFQPNFRKISLSCTSTLAGQGPGLPKFLSENVMKSCKAADRGGEQIWRRTFSPFEPGWPDGYLTRRTTLEQDQHMQACRAVGDCVDASQLDLVLMCAGLRSTCCTSMFTDSDTCKL